MTNAVPAQAATDIPKGGRDIYTIMDRWERQIEVFNDLEEIVDKSMEKLIAHRPGRYSKKFDEEGLKIATQTYIAQLENGGALRESVRELRSIQTRFPGQIMDCEDTTPAICGACRSYAKEVRSFLKLYCR